MPPQIKATTAKKAIAPGYMCDWMGTGGQPLQYMPDAKAADEGFKKRYPAKQGMFGTKNQPEKWFNAIWCSTNGDNYSCIYTEASVTPGMDYRGYQVENNYQASDIQRLGDIELMFYRFRGKQATMNLVCSAAPGLPHGLSALSPRTIRTKISNT